MGDYPDKVEDIYCSRCRRVTKHNIYKKTKRELDQEVVIGEKTQYTRTIGGHTYRTRKQVWNVCWKTKKTTEDCCKIM